MHFSRGYSLCFLVFSLPDVIFEPLHGLGKSTIYLSMLYIGAMLVQTRVRGIMNKPHIFLLSFNKLLLIPLYWQLQLIFITYLFFPGFGDIARKVVILEASMPCMATIVVMANKFGSDSGLATENVFISTIFSIFSIPLVYSGLIILDQFMAGIAG